MPATLRGYAHFFSSSTCSNRLVTVSFLPDVSVCLVRAGSHLHNRDYYYPLRDADDLCIQVISESRENRAGGFLIGRMRHSEGTCNVGSL